MVKIGDRITIKPVTFSVTGANGKEKAIPGTVVYVHPAGRYCTVEFAVGNIGATVRESFKLVKGEILE